MSAIFTVAVPATMSTAVTEEFPTVIEVAFVFPRLSAAAPPVSIVVAAAPPDKIDNAATASSSAAVNVTVPASFLANVKEPFTSFVILLSWEI